MRGFDKCPVCGGEIATKDVEKIVRGGAHTAAVHVRADVCLHCGERLYTPEQVRRFEDLRRKLQRRETQGLKHVGEFFEVA
ncbi:MAG: YgiT-type zinc finger protein [Phycisphaerae bacterium]|nr:YgiT-type zinc finger protein [Phycisphaerae bacterium]